MVFKFVENYQSEINITDFKILIEVIERQKLPNWYQEEVRYFLYKYYFGKRDLGNVVLNLQIHFRTPITIFMYPLDEMKDF